MADPLAAPDWREEDAAWERLCRDVGAALRANDMPLVRRGVGQMLSLSEAYFQAGDPRLAASLTAQAWQLRARQPRLAARLFEDAIAHWDQAFTWLAGQPSPSPLARSSSFHLRLESKHPGAYQERRRDDLTSSLACGRALTEGLGLGSPSVVPEGPKAAWPSNTARKIDTAIDLLRLLEAYQTGRIATL